MAEIGRQPLTRQPRGRPDPAVRSQEYDPPSDLLQPLQDQRDLSLHLRKRLGVPKRLDDVGPERAQEQPIALREVQSAPVQRNANDPWRGRREPNDHLVLDANLAKELVIKPKAPEFALGQEVGDLGGTSVRVPAEMLDERMLVPVVLEGQHEVRS